MEGIRSCLTGGYNNPSVSSCMEKAHMNNTSFSRIRNVDNITNMGYSLNRVSPIFREQGQTPVQSTKPRNPTSTPRQKPGHINKNSVPQGAET